MGFTQRKNARNEFFWLNDDRGTGEWENCDKADSDEVFYMVGISVTKSLPLNNGPVSMVPLTKIMSYSNFFVLCRAYIFTINITAKARGSRQRAADFLGAAYFAK